MANPKDALLGPINTLPNESRFLKVSNALKIWSQGFSKNVPRGINVAWSLADFAPFHSPQWYRNADPKGGEPKMKKLVTLFVAVLLTVSFSGLAVAGEAKKAEEKVAPATPPAAPPAMPEKKAAKKAEVKAEKMEKKAEKKEEKK
jgi:hypothetical protein